MIWQIFLAFISSKRKDFTIQISKQILSQYCVEQRAFIKKKSNEKKISSPSADKPLNDGALLDLSDSDDEWNFIYKI